MSVPGLRNDGRESAFRPAVRVTRSPLSDASRCRDVVRYHPYGDQTLSDIISDWFSRECRFTVEKIQSLTYRLFDRGVRFGS